MKTLTHGFELDGKSYRTDERTIKVLRGIIPSAKATGDSSAVAAVMVLGQMTGCVVEVAA